MSSQSSCLHIDNWWMCCRIFTLARLRSSIVRFSMDHLVECPEEFAEKMGRVDTRAVVEHGLAVRRRDGQSRAEGEQDPEPHLERASLDLTKSKSARLPSKSRPVLRGCRAHVHTLTHVSSRHSHRQTKSKRKGRKGASFLTPAASLS